MSAVLTKAYAIMIQWPIGSGRRVPLKLFAIGPQLCKVRYG
jgi:hypothetical protein